jgi:hypothetical protein
VSGDGAYKKSDERERQEADYSEHDGWRPYSFDREG